MPLQTVETAFGHRLIVFRQAGVFSFLPPSHVKFFWSLKHFDLLNVEQGEAWKSWIRTTDNAQMQQFRNVRDRTLVGHCPVDNVHPNIANIFTYMGLLVKAFSMKFPFNSWRTSTRCHRPKPEAANDISDASKWRSWGQSLSDRVTLILTNSKFEFLTYEVHMNINNIDSIWSPDC